MPQDDLGISVLKSACSSEAKDLAVDWAEFGLDALLKEGVLKDAPMLGAVVKICAISKTIRDRLFVRKVWDFLRACPKFTEAEKEAFVREHLNEPKKAQRLGDAVVLILDKLDDLEKPEMLAKVFGAFVRRQISYDAFRRLSAGIDIASAEDLKALGGKPIVPESLAEPYPTGLVRCGFAHWILKGNALGSRVGQAAEISELGRLFAKCTLQE